MIISGFPGVRVDQTAQKICREKRSCTFQSSC